MLRRLWQSIRNWFRPGAVKTAPGADQPVRLLRPAQGRTICWDGRLLQNSVRHPVHYPLPLDANTMPLADWISAHGLPLHRQDAIRLLGIYHCRLPSTQEIREFQPDTQHSDGEGYLWVRDDRERLWSITRHQLVPATRPTSLRCRLMAVRELTAG